MRELQSLNGIWDYRAAEGPWDKREIPYADLPVGFAECRRTFDVSGGYTGRRAFLRLPERQEDIRGIRGGDRGL